MAWLAGVTLALSAAILGCAGAGAAQKPVSAGPEPARAGPLTPEFGRFVKHKLDKWRVPGMAIAVIDGHDVHAEGYGFATLPDVRATPETLWFGASTTKAQVAAVLAHLIDSREHPELARGWSTPISSIIRDDFVLQDEWATGHVTLDDAVSHRSGMPRHDKASAHLVNGTQATPRDLVRNLRNLPMTGEPRVSFYYCNLMYVTLGHVIETITGSWLGKVLRDVIWGPLGMNSTYLRLEDAQSAPEHLATGYYWDKGAREYRAVAPMELTEMRAAGGVISNVVDYAQWIKCLLHQAPPFPPSVHQDIRTPRVLETTAPRGGLDISLYALGWSRTLYKGHVLYSHNGGLDAFGTQVYWLPDAKFGAVAFANTASTSNAVEDVVIFRLIEDKLGIPEGERFDFDKQWQETINKTWGEVHHADRIVFPDHPDPPLPSTFKTGDLVGTYSNPGYGAFTLRQEPNPDKPDETVLVADRMDMTWRYQIRLHHVSGDYWIVHGKVPDNPTFLNEIEPAEFRRGVDGKVSALEIEWSSRLDHLYEGKAIFKKMS